MVKVFSTSKFVNHLSSAVIGSDSQFFSYCLKVGILLIGSPELNSDFCSSSDWDIFEVSFSSTLSTLDRTIFQRSVIVLSDQLEGFKIIRSESTQRSASYSNSVNGVSFSWAVEVFSQRRSYQRSFISKKVLLNRIIDSFVMFVGAHSSITFLLSIENLFLDLFGNLVEVSSSISVRNLTVLSSIVIRVVQFLITTVKVVNISSAQTNDFQNQI